MNTRKPYKTYTKDFKIAAVRLMGASDRPAAEIATELGICLTRPELNPIILPW